MRAKTSSGAVSVSSLELALNGIYPLVWKMILLDSAYYQELIIYIYIINSWYYLCCADLFILLCALNEWERAWLSLSQARSVKHKIIL